MSVIKMQANKMSDATVSFISLVGRGANRIPFKIIKQEKDHMSKAFSSMDLGSLFTRKSEKVAAATIAAVVCMKGDHMEALKEELVAAGFSVANQIENADGSVVFAQGDSVLKADEGTVIRLSDDILLVAKGFSPYNMEGQSGNSFADQCIAQGFYPGIRTVMDTLSDTIRSAVSASSSPADAGTSVSKMFDEAKAYALSFVSQLPVAAFKLDTGENRVVTYAIKSEAEVQPTADDLAQAEVAKQEEVAKGKMSPAELTYFKTLTGADKMAFMTADSAGRAKAMAGGVDDHDEDNASVKKAQAPADTQAMVAAEVSKSGEALTASLKTMLDAFSGSIQKSMDSMEAKVSGMQERIEKAEGVALTAQQAVSGTVVMGSESGDQIAARKAEQGNYAGREIDTAFSGSRKAKR